jgi:predicted nucleotidyltransferase component of viral defense system
MADDRLKTWETLFRHALVLTDSVRDRGGPVVRWTFGGGTVLMRRHQHRFSKDVDIFVPDPQYFGYFSPRLSDAAASLTSDYLESGLSLKLFFPEGEIDFIASEPLTAAPSVTEQILGRAVEVETTSEIIAKKVWHRGKDFKARDILDLAVVAEREPQALREIRPILDDRREAVLARIAKSDKLLRDDFAQLELMTYRRTYEECVELATSALRGT